MKFTVIIRLLRVCSFALPGYRKRIKFKEKEKKSNSKGLQHCNVIVAYSPTTNIHDARQHEKSIISEIIYINVYEKMSWCVSVRFFSLIGSTRMICTMFASTKFDMLHTYIRERSLHCRCRAAACSCNRYVQGKKTILLSCFSFFLTAAQLERKRHDENRH